LVTNAPRPASIAIQPCAQSSSYAATTVLRATPSCRANVRLEASRVPTRNRPRSISVAIAIAICWNSGWSLLPSCNASCQDICDGSKRPSPLANTPRC
jgi:hypothetical protein